MNRSAGISDKSVTPPPNRTVAPLPGYNSWPFLAPLNGKLVCVYSRGIEHSFAEPARGVYSRVSADGGETWSGEYPVVNAPDGGDSAIGKGLDGGAMLVWVRHVGEEWRHELYRTEDGVRFQRIAQLRPDPMPMQITDIFTVPGAGLMSLWFAGTYRERGGHSWGTLVSRDHGLTWEQNVVESDLDKADWPTEPSAVWLGGGRILAVARAETCAGQAERAQFQLQSEDCGRTWKRFRTDIADVQESTPSLIFDKGLIYNYYFQRTAGLLKCRTAAPDAVWGKPLDWPEPEVVALGSTESYHAGNVNAAFCGDAHGLAFYSGTEDGTEIVFQKVPRRAALPLR